MPLTAAAIKTILDIKDDVVLDELEMAKKLNITFFPHVSKNANPAVISFSEKLKQAFIELGVNIIPYEQTLENVPWPRKIKMVRNLFLLNFKKFFKGDFGFFNFKWGKKVKRGVAIIATGEGETGNLPIDYVTTLKHNPIITIVDKLRDKSKGKKRWP